MTEQDVKEIIAKDMQAMNEAPFPEPLPEWLLSNFDKIIMEMPQSANPYFAETLESILSKKNPNDLTFYEGGFVLNVINSVAPKFVAKDIKTFIHRKRMIGRIMYRYNVNLKKEENKLAAKEQTLMRGMRNTKLITV
jgi:hypothetical protein